MGGRLSMNALVASQQLELVAAADINEAVRADLEACYPGLRTFADHRRMFAECPTDITCVATWPPSHLPVVRDALHMPGLQGLLCEKPLGDTARAGREILEAVQAQGKPVVVPHGLLKARHGEQILARVHAGEIGSLELVEIECHRWDIINAGIHWLDFFLNLVPDDPPAWVMALAEASTQTFRDGMQVETTAVTYVQTAAGVRCVMHTGDDVLIRRPGKSFSFRLIGSAGQIEFWAWDSACRITNAVHPCGHTYKVPAHPQSAHQRYLEDLAQQIDRGQPEYALPELSLAALQLCEAAYFSSAYRCRVALPFVELAPPCQPEWHPGQPYQGQGGRDGRKLGK
jgi:predicted dehydrogenase